MSFVFSMNLSDLFDETWVILVYFPMILFYLFWWVGYGLIRKRKNARLILFTNVLIHLGYISALAIAIIHADRVEAPIYPIFPLLTGIHTLLLLIFCVLYRMNVKKIE